MDLDLLLDENQEPETSIQERLARKVLLKKDFKKKQSEKDDEETDEDNEILSDEFEFDDEIKVSEMGSLDLISKSTEKGTDENIGSMKGIRRTFSVEEEGKPMAGSDQSKLTSKGNLGGDIISVYTEIKI